MANIDGGGHGLFPVSERRVSWTIRPDRRVLPLTARVALEG
ncbi:MAG: hypothetical protein WAV07_01940 [Candidatus Contendobacter sp.]